MIQRYSIGIDIDKFFLRNKDSFKYIRGFIAELGLYAFALHLQFVK
jgi:hypothetical protein